MRLHPRTACAPLFLGILAWVSVADISAQDTSVYTDRWSEPAITAAKDGKPFQGPFANQSVSLLVTRLPAHRWVKVSFELYIMGSWDGSNAVWGPDLWTMSVRGGPRLISSTFAALSYVNNSDQSYPDDFPRALHPAWTGASRRDVLNSPDARNPASGVYKIELLFPHADKQLMLDFAGSYDDQPIEKQCWGVGNVQVSTADEATLTKATDLPELWSALASEDAMKANAALWRFIGAGEDALTFLKAQVVQLPEGNHLSPTDSLRLHRAHRIARIIGGENASQLCFAMDHLFPEYFGNLPGQ